MREDTEILVAPQDAYKATNNGMSGPGGAGGRATEFSQLYKNVQAHVSKALADLSDINIASKEGNEHLAAIRKRLTDLHARFSGEIDYLDSQAEWETFTMAFFGETNAGKSTIIESLRILFQEQDRQTAIRESTARLEDMQEQFSAKSDKLVEELSRHYASFTAGLADLSQQASELRDAVKDDNATTRDAVSREVGRMADALEARHGAFQERMAGLERDVADLRELIRTENKATRTLFSDDTERLIHGLSERAETYRRETAAICGDLSSLADVARGESEAAQAARKRRERVRLITGVAAGLAFGAAAAIAFSFFRV